MTPAKPNLNLGDVIVRLVLPPHGFTDADHADLQRHIEHMAESWGLGAQVAGLRRDDHDDHDDQLRLTA